MSLERFRRSKLIVLQPTATVYEAARAMKDNHVGAVLVADGHHVVGILTDRDLALDVIEADFDARETRVEEIMTGTVGTCDVNAGVNDVLVAMRQYGCRRIPVTRLGRPIGLVTLDDLVLDGVVPLDALREVIAGQLEMAARHKPEGALYPERRPAPFDDGRARARTRHEARAEAAQRRLLRGIMRETRLTRENAETAVTVVLRDLCRRMRPEDARHLIAQLPSRTQDALLRHLDGPHKEITVESIETELGRELGIAPGAAALLLDEICASLGSFLSPGSVETLRVHLPPDLRELFPAASEHHTSP